MHEPPCHNESETTMIVRLNPATISTLEIAVLAECCDRISRTDGELICYLDLEGVEPDMVDVIQGLVVTHDIRSNELLATPGVEIRDDAVATTEAA